MTDTDKKLIFDYLGWEILYKNISEAKYQKHFLNGNDILEAVKIINEKQDWTSFKKFYVKEFTKNIRLEYIEVWYLLNFFPLLAEWRKEKGE